MLKLTIFSVMWILSAMAEDPCDGFMCSSRELCIDHHEFCDGIEDCQDASDEPTGCELEKTCEPDSFLCDTYMCVPRDWLCDGREDCHDGTDELNCQNNTCDNRQFRCQTGHCIDEAWFCDGDRDCDDGEDEPPEICPEAAGHCILGEWKCVNGRCITEDFKCDNFDDCGDNSDEMEENCPTYKPHCPEGMFHCVNTSRCIPVSWLCDSTPECPDGSDEANCDHIIRELTCGPMDFKCPTTGECIPVVWTCDGQNDCPDAADEAAALCTHQESATTLRASHVSSFTTSTPSQAQSHSCPSGTYQCASLQCLPFFRVCDGNPDCSDRSDEGGECGTACHNDSGDCSHSCSPTPRGPMCTCFDGYHLVSGNICRDIDECHGDNFVCSQYCINFAGSYRCDCMDGYALGADRRTCKVTGPMPVLILSMLGEVRQLTLDGYHYDKIIQTVPGILIAMDFDSKTGDIYWKNTAENKIMRYSNDHRTSYVFLDNMPPCEDLAIDWVARNLYYIEIGDSPAIWTCSLTTGYCLPVVNTTDMVRPRALVLDPLAGLMFWSEWGQQGRILRAWMTGKKREPVAQFNIAYPSSLAIDMAHKRLFWIDYRRYVIESADYNGANRQEVYRAHGLHAFGLVVFEDDLYWTNMDAGTLNKVNKFTGQGYTTVLQNLTTPMAVKVKHPVKQPPGLNLCERMINPCSHLCLLEPHGSAACFCPPGMAFDDGSAAPYKCIGEATGPMTVTPSCAAGYCLNGGTCQQDNKAIFCICPAGFAGGRCDNRTGIFLVNPILAKNSYAWVAGVLCFLIVSIASIAGAIYCCRKKRRNQENEMISIIRFRNAILGRSSKNRRTSQQILVESSYENPGFHPEDDVNANTPKVVIASSPSQESIDSAFLSRRDSLEQELDSPVTRPLTKAENYDSS